MEEFKEGQYDDDLTQGSFEDDLTEDIAEFDDGFDTGDIDLFGYTDDEDSVLGRLKSIILSIEWEITDEILRQFNEELQELRGVWENEKINLIYVQALEKISRYIYKEKSSAHPHAIKLLLTFYSNLEKIVSDESLSEREKKKTLKADIELFEKLKKQISQSMPAEADIAAETISVTSPAETLPPALGEDTSADDSDDEDDPLLSLKAIVYGIDWEVTDTELNNLSQEVKRLEDLFDDSKAKKIFLQGIGSLGAYINLKRSDAHADAFKLLHSFFSGLETTVRGNLSGQAEKDVLLPQVEKFNVFKTVIADTVTPDKVSKAPANIDEVDEVDEVFDDGEIQPAFADVPEDVEGFRVEDEGDGEEVDEYFVEEAQETKQETQEDSALANEMESRLEGMFDEPPEEVTQQLDKNTALQGVNVETEDDDDSDEEPLPVENGELAPALAAEDSPVAEESPAILADDEDDLFEENEVEMTETFSKDIPGVDVEHEADDESGEEPLPFDGDEYAPALSGDDGEKEVKRVPDEAEAGDIDNRLDDFFGESEEEGIIKPEIEPPELEQPSVAEPVSETIAVSEPEPEPEKPKPVSGKTAPVANEIEGKISDFFEGAEPQEVPTTDPAEAIKGVDVETEADDDSDEEPLPLEGDELAPALSTEEDFFSDSPVADSQPVAGEVEEQFDDLFGEESDVGAEEDDDESRLAHAESDQIDDNEFLLDQDASVEEDTAEQTEQLQVDDSFDESFDLGGTQDEIATDNEEILAQPADRPEDDEPSLSAYEETDLEENIPEMEVDDLATVIEDGGAISTAGTVPSGYPSTDELLREFGEVTGDEELGGISHPEEDEAYIISIEKPDGSPHEEEVVFQAVEGSSELIKVSEEDLESDDTFGITLLDDEYISQEGDGQHKKPEIAPSAQARSSAYVKPHGDAALHDSLGGLRNCIASLGLEIDTDILNSLNEEIEKLRHKWMEKPAEKTFIQLLSTISSHINRYRYDADQEANKLLLSIFDKLELTALQQASESEIQEALLNETSKVLQWQERLIDRTPEKTEISEQRNGDSGPGLDEMSKRVDEIGNDMVMQHVSTIMKEELEQLKKDFHAELFELRKDILAGSEK